MLVITMEVEVPGMADVLSSCGCVGEEVKQGKGGGEGRGGGEGEGGRGGGRGGGEEEILTGILLAMKSSGGSRGECSVGSSSPST